MNRIVIDANIVAAMVLPVPYTSAVVAAFENWNERGAPLFAPALWYYEITTALRKAVAAGVLNAAQATARLRKCADLSIDSVYPTFELQERALAWAERLGQRAAYDASYLAVAEYIGADLWTADRALARNARRMGIGWVHHIEDDLE